jgi:hypothetical protein
VAKRNFFILEPLVLQLVGACPSLPRVAGTVYVV